MEAYLTDLWLVSHYADLVNRFAAIDGYLENVEGYALMELAAEGPGVGAIVELGSFMGRSTCWLAAGAKQASREKVTAIDHFKGSPEHQPGGSSESAAIRERGTTLHLFEGNLKQAGLDDYVEPIVASSEEAAKKWDKPIRLLFIDGDHSYEASRQDFALWAPFVVPGGVIAFHDVGNWPGVTRFYDAFMATPSPYTEAFRVQSLAVVVKGETGATEAN